MQSSKVTSAVVGTATLSAILVTSVIPVDFYTSDNFRQP
jgi:hypothetical protein